MIHWHVCHLDRVISRNLKVSNNSQCRGKLLPASLNGLHRKPIDPSIRCLLFTSLAYNIHFIGTDKYTDPAIFLEFCKLLPARVSPFLGGSILHFGECARNNTRALRESLPKEYRVERGAYWSRWQPDRGTLFNLYE